MAMLAGSHRHLALLLPGKHPCPDARVIAGPGLGVNPRSASRLGIRACAWYRSESAHSTGTEDAAAAPHVAPMTGLSSGMIDFTAPSFLIRGNFELANDVDNLRALPRDPGLGQGPGMQSAAPLPLGTREYPRVPGAATNRKNGRLTQTFRAKGRRAARASADVMGRPRGGLRLADALISSRRWSSASPTSSATGSCCRTRG